MANSITTKTAQDVAAPLPRVSVQRFVLGGDEPSNPEPPAAAPALPIVAVARAEGGGLLAAAVPSVQSGTMANADVSDEWRVRARSAAQQSLVALGAERTIGVTVVFVKDANRVDTGGPRLAYKGFVSRTHPNVAFIYADEVTLKDLGRIVAHEVAHLVYNARHPDDDGDHAPWDESPSEQFAHAFTDRLYGPDPEGTRRSAEARRYAQSVAMLKRVALPSGDVAEIEHGSITVTNAGAVIIIDGTSDMFRIAASGSQSIVSSSGATPTTSTTLSSLTYSAAPVTIPTITTVNSSATPQVIGMAPAGGVFGQFIDNTSSKFAGFEVLAWTTVYLSVSHPVVTLNAINASGSAKSYYQNYYVLEQTAF